MFIFYRLFFNIDNMKQKDYGDRPNIPEQLKKPLEDQLLEDTPKRSWRIKIVRHTVKQLLKKLIS